MPVPCKLNNVRQTKHLGQLYGLFKFDVKIEINSQRKFLSNFAKTNLFKNLILELRL